MATRRSYHDACGLAHALDLIGERWALLVVRELVLGPKRYTDLRAGLPGISTNVLSDRLDELERVGVLIRRRLPPPAGSSVYELTEWGQELEPIVTRLGRWGFRSPAHLVGARYLSAVSLVLSLRTNFDPSAAGGFTARYELRFGEECFAAEVAEGRFTAARGGAERPDATVGGTPMALASVVYGGRALDEVRAAGELSVTGDHASVERFATLFHFPEPAPVPGHPA